MSSKLTSNLIQNGVTPGREADAFTSLTVPSRQASVQASRPSSVTPLTVPRRRSKAPHPPRRPVHRPVAKASPQAATPPPSPPLIVFPSTHRPTSPDPPRHPPP